MPLSQAEEHSALEPFSSPEWAKLLRHFEFDQRFSWIFRLVGDSSLARLCQEELDLWLCARNRPSLFPIAVNSPDDLANVPERLQRMEPPAGPIWIPGSGPRQLYQNAWEHLAPKLNGMRDTTAKRFLAPVILVGPSWIQEIFRYNAPDLWSTRAFVSELPIPAASPRNAESGFGILLNPDFMLAQAATLRGKPGREPLLAELLIDAADELMLHKRSREAMSILKEAIVLREQLIKAHPSRADYKLDLAAALARIPAFEAQLNALPPSIP